MKTWNLYLILLLAVGCDETPNPLIAQKDDPKERQPDPVIAELEATSNADEAPPPIESSIVSIHWAARNGNVVALEKHIELGTSISAREPNSDNTPLHFAVNFGQIEAISLLLEHGAKKTFSYKNRDGKTPLDIAVDRGNEKVVALLLEEISDRFLNKMKEDPDNYVLWLRMHYDTEYGRMVEDSLEYAVRNRDKENIRMLVTKGADLDGQLIDADDVKSVEFLLKIGANPNPERILHRKTALNEAVRHGRLEIAKQLITGGANVNETRDGSPLNLAVKGGNLPMIELLLENGADISGSGTKTPLHVAAEAGRSNVIRYLLQQGCAIDATNPLGETPLHIAAKSGCADAVKLLLEKGADADVKDKRGKTPKWVAHQSVTELLP